MSLLVSAMTGMQLYWLGSQEQEKLLQLMDLQETKLYLMNKSKPISLQIQKWPLNIKSVQICCHKQDGQT